MKKSYGEPNIPWQPLVNLSADVREYMLTGLEPNTTYAFRVRGLSESGVNSNHSLTKKIFTLSLGEYTHHSTTCTLFTLAELAAFSHEIVGLITIFHIYQRLVLQ